MKNLDSDFLEKNVLNSDPKFCLMEERVRLIKEMAVVIEKDFDGKFTNFVQKSGYDCA